MFKSPKDYIIVALVLLLAGVILFRKSAPLPDNGKNEYEKNNERLTAQLSIKDAQIGAVVKESEDTIKYFQAIVGTQNKEIKAQKVRNAELRNPVQPLIDSVPALKAFIQSQDSLLLVTEQRADTIQKAYTSQIETTRDLKKLIVDKDKIQNEMFTTCSERVDKLQRDYEKEHKRKGTWRKVAGIAIIVSLVEGALIALQ